MSGYKGANMFYVYRNTPEDSVLLAQFTDKEKAVEFMEWFYSVDFAENTTGYAVRDYKLKTYSEIEV